MFVFYTHEIDKYKYLTPDSYILIPGRYSFNIDYDIYRPYKKNLNNIESDYDKDHKIKLNDNTSKGNNIIKLFKSDLKELNEISDCFEESKYKKLIKQHIKLIEIYINKIKQNDK